VVRREMRALVLASVLACLFLPFIAAQSPIEPGLVNATYRFLLDEEDYQYTRPGLGPIGGTVYFTWSEVHTGPGEFDWRVLEEKLSRAAGHWVTLDGPEPVQVPQPVQVFAVTQLSNPIRSYVPSRIPNGTLWLNWGHCDAVPVPNYKSDLVRSEYEAFVAEFGRVYGNDLRINSVVIGSVGIDGEAQLAKDAGDCQWSTAAKEIPGLEYAWGQWVDASIPLYKEAFPNKPLFFPIAVGGQARCHWADICAEHGVGLKHNGATTDLPDWESSCCGAFAAFEDFPGLRAIETKSGWLGSAWDITGALTTVKPDMLVVHPDYLDNLPAGLLRQFSAVLGKTSATTPYAFIVMRGPLYPRIDWCEISGKLTDDEMWLSRVEGGQLLQGDDVPAAARGDYKGDQLRRGPMKLDLDADFDVSRNVTIAVDWFDQGEGSWGVTWWDGDKWQGHTIYYDNLLAWRTALIVGVTLDSTGDEIIAGVIADIGISGEPYIHKVRVDSHANLFKEPTATPEPTAIPFPTSGITPTVEKTITLTPTVTETPTPFSTRTLQEDVYDYERHLNGRLFAELGPGWRVKVTIEGAMETYPVRGTP